MLCDVMKPHYCSPGLSLCWFHQAHLCRAELPHPFFLTVRSCRTLVMLIILIVNPGFFNLYAYLLFAPHWHMLHLLRLWLSLGGPSHGFCYYLQAEGSLIFSLLLVSPYNRAPNPSTSNTVCDGYVLQKGDTEFFLSCAASHSVCQIRVLPWLCLS